MKRKAGTLDVCGIPFAVYLADEKSCPELKGSYGICHPESQEIYVQAGMPRDITRFYVLHEALHAVYSHTGTRVVFNGGKSAADKEETFVRAWTPALIRLLEDFRGLPL